MKMKQKTIFIIIGSIIILAAGAFFAGKLINQKAISMGNSIISSDGVSESTEIRMETTPAAELPTLPPTTSGIFVNRVDNIITMKAFVSTAFGEDKKVIASVNEDGEMNMDIDGDSQQVEIYVNNQTKLYCNTTSYMDAVNEGKEFIQQTVEEGSIDELNATSFITVWGRKNGDRIIADTILYDNPSIEFD